MTFAPMNTANVGKVEPTKTLCYGLFGSGKTYQCRNFQRRFGKGFIISGEAGLKSLVDTGIDYLPFSSWDGPVDPARGIYSFKAIRDWVNGPDFRARDYKWVAIDSLTELGDRLWEYIEAKHAGSENGFAIWGDYNREMLAALKWVRDLPLHVYVTALAREREGEGGLPDFALMLRGSGTAQQAPGIFDNVFAAVRVSETDPATGIPKVRRYFVTDEYKGWHGKARDPLRRLKTIEPADDITELLTRIMKTGDDNG